MLFSSAKLLAVALALTGCAVGSPVEVDLDKRGAHVPIGFRRVSEAQAREYAAAGNTLTLTRKVNGAQLGQAVYTSQTRDGWPANPQEWYCVIQADKAALDKTAKAWIPRADWFKKDKVIDAYIKQHKVDPAKTLRLSEIDGSQDHVLQMAIPPGLLGAKKGDRGPLDISVECVRPPTTLPAPRDPIDYAHWPGFVNHQ
ncbi:hypothetical protein ETB97_011031 [Aspergillus alliaceus]|uniref:Uncharacterized protein n=1 Tax=Petromyces alliaceus TaxID=209559 RepID=A0A5N6FT55_PETAA|nr:uncharacterized protein BDW43DRAFT_311275 [Aspergillus alliaceus]KAB8233201.1 hypothetical protein BDW43DRAFT_311275 [Aspergillus alliaceus]KAF5862890.1 hypothetical protein ETB97_011031 [Aspergillus burnettii]